MNLLKDGYNMGIKQVDVDNFVVRIHAIVMSSSI